MIKDNVSRTVRKIGEGLIRWADSLSEAAAKKAGAEIAETADDLEKVPVGIVAEETADQPEAAEKAEEYGQAAATAEELPDEIEPEEENPLLSSPVQTEEERPSSVEPGEIRTETKEKSPEDELAAFRISQDPRVEEERRRNKEAELKAAEEKKKKLKKSLFLIPVACLLILVAATVPSYMKSKQAYEAASALLEEKDYDAAQQAFADLGNYSDSQEQVLFEIPYRKAIQLLKCAQDNDESGLILAGTDQNSLPEGSSAQVVMYEKAVEMFTLLNSYKDSEKKIAVANAGIDEYYEKKNLSAYNEAKELLEDKMYLPAMEAFMNLGEYRDCEDLVKECIYRRAKGLLGYAEENNIRGISMELSHDSSVKTQISIPRSLLVEQAGDAVALIELKDTCGKRCSDIIYEDVPGEQFLPLCSAIAAEFESIDGYKDSAELKQKAEDTGDFTREFFELCRSGYLSRAREWLDKYDDAFESRSAYSGLIDLFLPYCRFWQFKTGDSTLIPFTAGEEGECEGIISAISLTDDNITLLLSPINSNYTVEMEYVPEASGFRMHSEESDTFTFVIVNENGTLTVARYNTMGFTLSSCEYQPV